MQTPRLHHQGAAAPRHRGEQHHLDSDADSDSFIVTVFLNVHTFRKCEMLIFLGSSTVIDFTIK